MKELDHIPIPKLDQHQQQMLDILVIDEEIEWVVHQIGPQKAPGLDGIPAFFYQEFWSIVKQYIF